MKCAYTRCSCTAETCQGKRRARPLKAWGKYCCPACGNKARMARYYERRIRPR